MKKECTENEARLKAESYCSASERCTEDVLHKLEQWGAPETAYDAILGHLKKERYVDNQRYAKAFVRDKYRFNQWGRLKISQALKMKYIESDMIRSAMEEVDEEEYLDILVSLLRRKLPSIKAATDYERKGKLFRFAAGRGYETGEILQCMKKIGYEDESFE